MFKYLPSLFISFIAIVALTACGGGGGGGTKTNGFTPTTQDPNLTRGDFISAKLLASKKASLLIPYDVDAFKIVYYTTDTKGKQIKASGLLGIPKKEFGEKSPLLSYQHGTIFLDTQAPSNSNTSAKGIMILAGTGYIVSAPDYIGYGEAANTIHPYVHANSLSRVSIDMLRASKHFLESKQIRTNGQLFLVGYSEGGYATLALQKALQESNSTEFHVTASAAGAGPFDLLESSKILSNQAINNKPAFMSFLLKSYNEIYGLNKISEMYQEKYVDAINTLFDGKHSAGDVNAKLTATTADLFNAPFLEAIKGSGAHVIKEKFALNNIYDWKPIAPTRFYHSKNDEIVPYQNSQIAYSTMRKNGAENVSFSDCPLNSHTDCAIPYVLNTVSFFSKYVDDL